MPPPVVYVVVVLTVACVGYGLYHIFKSDSGSSVGGQSGGRRRRNERQLVSPHQTDPSSSGGSTHEMRDMGLSASQSSTTTSNRLPQSTGIRNRRSNTSGRNAEDASATASLIDRPNDSNIPVTPLAPESNPWSSVQASRLQPAGLSGSPFADPAPRPSSPSRPNEVLFDVSEASPDVTPTRSPGQSPFELGSESPTLASTSPRSDDLPLSESLESSSPILHATAAVQSPFEGDSGPSTPRSASPESSYVYQSGSQAALSTRATSPPHIQLPTPSDSEIEVVSPTSPATRADLLEWTAVSPTMYQDNRPASPSSSNVPLPHSLSPDLFAPPISRTATDMSASFFTAESPATEFRSFPPTEPTSPFSESFALSGDDDMYSLPSHSDSDESLPAFAVPEEERHRNDGLTFVVGRTTAATTQGERREDPGDSLSEASGYAESSGDFSDESWSEFSVPPTSPRH